MSSPRRVDLEAGSWVEHWAGLLEPTSDSWFAQLRVELPFREEHHQMFGRQVVAPRLVSWHGDPEARYRYSGIAHEPAPWTDGLSTLRSCVEEATKLQFNAVLANLYRDGRDGMGWHSDNEPEVGPSPEDRWIASLSFGAPRRFILRHRHTEHTTEFTLGAGDLLLMRGATQSDYRHRVAKTARTVGPRINLTFRHIGVSGCHGTG